MKMRVVRLRAVDLLYWVIAWTIIMGAGAILCVFVVKEALFPHIYLWLGGLTFAEIMWICEFAIPYLIKKQKEKKEKGQEDG